MEDYYLPGVTPALKTAGNAILAASSPLTSAVFGPEHQPFNGLASNRIGRLLKNPEPPLTPEAAQLLDTQIYNLYPNVLTRALYPFNYEREWMYGSKMTDWARNTWQTGLPMAIVTVYVIAIFGTQYYLRDRKPLAVEGVWKWWNLALSLFSFCGAIRMMPHLITHFMRYGLYTTMCEPAAERYGLGATGLWTYLFVFSKIPELFDTAFIVLGKRKLIFLHWYHHVTVLLFCWHSYAYVSSAGVWFIAMNYTVHAVMYAYFFFAACGIKLRSIAPLITLLQISQMAIGVTVCISTAYYHRQGLSCDVTDGNWLAGLIMYASYFFLFSSFAVVRYCKGGKKKKVSTMKEKGSEESSMLKNGKGKGNRGLRRRRKKEQKA